MNPIIHIIRKVFIRRFYVQNAGFFLFVFVVMAGIIDTLQEDDIMALVYQYQLIMGVLGSNVIFCLLLFVWLLYCIKCIRFVLAVLSAPESSFLQLLALMPGKTVFILFAGLLACLYFPVLIYSAIIIAVAISHQLYIKAGIIVFFQLIVCSAGAKRFQQKLRRGSLYFNFRFLPALQLKIPKPYFSFLLTYLFTELTLFVAGIKIFSCFLLYIFLRNLEQGDYDFRLMMLLYTIGLACHAVIIHKTRELEETRLVFYRQLPLPRLRRWMQYVIFYMILIIPEALTLDRFVPFPLHTPDGVRILLFGLSFLLLQHAILSAALMRLTQFLKIVLGIFMVAYFFILANAYVPIIILMFITATALFIRQYYRFELRTIAS